MRFIIGVMVGIVLVPVATLVYFLSGRAPVTASDPPLPFERLFAMTAIRARMKQEMPASVPLQADEATYLAGAQVYRRYCGGCHGLLNRPESPGAKGMSPHPPQLLEPTSMVTDDPSGETFWKVKNGIRLSGMPGFKATLSEEQMWQVSVMLANADQLPDTVKQELTFTPPASPAPPTPATAKEQSRK